MPVQGAATACAGQLRRHLAHTDLARQPGQGVEQVAQGAGGVVSVRAVLLRLWRLPVGLQPLHQQAVARRPAGQPVELHLIGQQLEFAVLAPGQADVAEAYPAPGQAQALPVELEMLLREQLLHAVAGVAGQ